MTHCHAVGVVALDQHQLAGHVHDEAGYVNPAMVALTTTTGVSTALAASPQVGQHDGHHTGGVDGQSTEHWRQHPAPWSDWPHCCTRTAACRWRWRYDCWQYTTSLSSRLLSSSTRLHYHVVTGMQPHFIPTNSVGQICYKIQSL